MASRISNSARVSCGFCRTPLLGARWNLRLLLRSDMSDPTEVDRGILRAGRYEVPGVVASVP
eukprot:scaffold8097_cov258-Pinguiococcus_pyrenoidosus.AAC.2